jgi:tetratricopeptide (TPR) repeat protein
VAFAEQADRDQLSPLQRQVWDRLAEEHDNLRSAIHWCVQNGEAELGLRLVGALHMFWHLCGHLGEGRAQAQQGLAMPGATHPSVARGQALFTAGTLAQLQGDITEARERWSELLEIGNSLLDSRLVARARSSLGILALKLDDLASARQHTECALSLSEELGEQLGLAVCLHYLGEIAGREREWDTARGLLQRALAVHRDPR